MTKVDRDIADNVGEVLARAVAARAERVEKARAFGEIVRRYQDLAFACAYGILGDFHLSEDAAQEAFLAAWLNLEQLREPGAFPGWLKRIVFSQCSRLTRGKRVPTVALEHASEVAAGEPDPLAACTERERREEVLRAIGDLPEHERLATALFYVGDYAQNEIARFLDVPLTTVKKRLFSARQRLRDRLGDEMLEKVGDTLRESRPSRDERFAETVTRYHEALDAFVAKVKRDRYILAAILFGSLSHDTVWRKSDIDLILVGRDDKGVKDFYLVENGVNIHAYLIPRARFRQLIEGTLQGAFMHSAFALSTLLYTHDDSIRALYASVRTLGQRDRQLRLMAAGGDVLGTLAKAEKWFVTRKDLAYSFLWIMSTVTYLAKIEVLLHDEITTREVVPRALALNPDFFGKIYLDLIQQSKDEATIQAALDRIEEYLDRRLTVLFGPILDYLTEEGGIRTTTDLDAYFKKQVQVDSLANVYEWLADKGIIQKVPYAVRLTPRSQVEVDEAAYYYDGGPR
ncbi:MAG TPA: sigma-70 family RNA polymerase sigma factor [Chloroflexota bacterium]|nr:sigma-70 family RNA polymerase sigma factor [Chloroflexota bacterium]